MNDTGANVQFALASAEFFYDCQGAWTDTACDANEEAMWNMTWRARLRASGPMAARRLPGGLERRCSRQLPGWEFSGGGIGGGGPAACPSTQ